MATVSDHWSIGDGNPKVRPEEDFSSMKVFRCHSNHRQRLFVQVHRGTNYVGIAVESLAPEVVAQDDKWSRVLPMLVVRMKETAQRRLNAQHVKVVPGGKIAEVLGDSLTCAKRSPDCVVGRHAVERAVSVPVVKVVGIRLHVPAMFLVLY